MSFVGYGSIATLTEQAKDPKRGPFRAMFWVVILLGILFVVMTFIASGIASHAPNLNQAELMQAHPNTGFYLLAGRVGGAWFGVVCAVANALALGVFNALVSTSSISRVTYVMSRSGALPRRLGDASKKTGIPISATLFGELPKAKAMGFLLHSQLLAKE